jgi:predicted 3-demethylubiquinone-9 3-methyltransferase (glyoxalase superfamily)
MTGKPFNTCLWFDTQAEEAANFYVSVFKNGKVGRITHYNDANPDQAGQVLTVEFEVNGQHFVGLNGGPQFKFDEAISLQVVCADQAEVDHYWSALTAAGGEEGPCGWLKDRFGLSWQVVPERVMELITGPDAEQNARATKALYSMRKIDIAAIEAAAKG